LRTESLRPDVGTKKKVTGIPRGAAVAKRKRKNRQQVGVAGVTFREWILLELIAGSKRPKRGRHSLRMGAF